jgi:membrane protein required for beta-lactamase induction
MDHSAEIDRINRELAILRDRLEIYRQANARLRWFFTWLVAPAILIVAILVFLHDALEGVFFAAMALVFGVLIAMLSKKSFGWIGYSFLRSPYAFYPDARPRPRNDAESIEIQIAQRERRLSELASQ